MTDGNEEYTITDYVSQNFAVTIGETWTCLTSKTSKTPKKFRTDHLFYFWDKCQRKGKMREK